MNLPFQIAKKYFFGKKSMNAINIITGISVLGVTLGAGALVLVMSVFNGFEDLIKSLYNSFQPDIMVTPVQGKVFTIDSTTYTKLVDVEGVANVAKSIEEIAFFEYKGSQDFGLIKGVDEEWLEVSRLDSVVFEGRYKLKSGTRNFAVVGYGMRNKMGISVEDYLSQMSVYMLKNKKVGNFEKPFKKQYLEPVGIFNIQQQIDEKYVISDLAFAQNLRDYKKGEISQLEIKLNKDFDSEETKEALKKILGAKFHVKDRYEQNEAFFKLMKVEKLIGFIITGLAGLLVSINMIGCMLMLIHEKKKDIAILKSMGADNNFIMKVFMNVGLLISGIGLIAGSGCAIFIYFLHKQYNLLPMEGFIVDAYPMSLRFTDFITIIFFVLFTGFLFSLFPAAKAAKIKSLVRND